MPFVYGEFDRWYHTCMYMSQDVVSVFSDKLHTFQVHFAIGDVVRSRRCSSVA